MAVRHPVPDDNKVNKLDYHQAHVFDGSPGMLLDAAGNEIDPGSLTVSGTSDGLASLFTTISTIPAPVTAFFTSGYSTAGVGGARYIYDTAVDAAYVAANPRTAKIISGRGFRLDPAQHLTIEMAGGIADRLLTEFTYSSPYTASWAVPGGVTDNSAALAAMFKVVGTTRPIGAIGEGGPLNSIHFANADARYGYHFGSTIIPPCSVAIIGNGAGGDVSFGVGTAFTFPANTPGIIFNHWATQPGGGVQLGTAGSRITGVRLMGGGGTDRTAHGLWNRMPIEWDDLTIENFAGNNYNNVGSVGQPVSGPLFGLTSGTIGGSLTSRNAGHNGFYVDGSDVSASSFGYVKVKGCRLTGYLDSGYFNNTAFVSVQEFGGGYVGACWYGGRNYALISGHPGIGSTTTPGTDDSIWHDWGAAAAASERYPAWSAAKTYEMSLPVYATGLGTELNCYIENYYLPAHVPPGAIYKGFAHTTRTTAIFNPDFTEPAIVSNYGYLQTQQYSPAHVTFGDFMKTSVGGRSGWISWHSRQNEASGGRYVKEYYADGILYGLGGIGTGNRAISFLATRNNTNAKFGAATAPVDVQEFFELAIGNGSGNPGTGRRVRFGSSAPASGSWGQGTIVFNEAPTAGGTVGWVCVTAGSPGTWKTFGAISA